MSSAQPSNGFLGQLLGQTAKHANTALDTIEHMLTFDRSVERGTNPTRENVVDQAPLEVLEAVAGFFDRVQQLRDRVYPVVHREIWERKRQSSNHRSSVPEEYRPPQA